MCNEAAAKAWGWDQPLGKMYPGTKQETIFSGKRVIGVVSNYHSKSLHQEIEPVIYIHRENLSREPRYIRLKIAEGMAPQTISELEDLWKKLNPEAPFYYFFWKISLPGNMQLINDGNLSSGWLPP